MHLTYLGVLIPCNQEKAYKIKYFILLDKIESNVQRLRSLSISMLGRVNIIQNEYITMLEVFQVLPFSIPSNFLNKIHGLLSNFI
jgi:hypothetical protein